MINKEGRYYRVNPYVNYRLERLTFDRFRNLNGLQIEFGRKGITGIFGANGLGKTSILNAIRCLYQPVYNPRHRKDRPRPIPYQPRPVNCNNEPFGHVFYGNQFFGYAGSKIVAEFSGGENENQHEISAIYEIRHGQQRWTPGTTAKPVRPVYYINMETCIPAMEASSIKAEREKRRRKYRSILAHSEELKNDFISIFQRNIEINTNTISQNVDEQLSIQMGGRNMVFRDLSAGEQRILKVLDTIHNAIDGSLILIDELEITLHSMALENLIRILRRLVKSKKLQIIFTSHSEALMERRDIDVRSLYLEGTSIKCAQGYNRDCAALLTGQLDAPRATILVEDEMSQAIITEILNTKGKLTDASVITFGGHTTAFQLASSLYVVNRLTEKTIFVLDGDVCPTQDEKEQEVENAHIIQNITVQAKVEIANHFKQYNLPTGMVLEPYLYHLLKSENDISNPVVRAAYRVIERNENNVPAGIQNVRRYLDHYMIQDTISNLGYRGIQTPIGYLEIVHHIAETHPNQWRDLTRNVDAWIDSHI